MDELIRQASLILRDIWLRRWMGLAVAWVVGIGGVAVLWEIPDQYEANAKMYVDADSVLRPLMAGVAVQPDVWQKIALLSRRLISRKNVEQLIQVAHLDLEGRPKEVVVNELMTRLEISGANKDNVYTLTMRDTQPDRARRVVEAMANIFIETNRGENQKDTSNAKQFIEEQIQVYEAKLSEAENRLKDFRVRHLGVADAGKDYFTRIDELNTRLKEARLELHEAENGRDALSRQINGENPTVLDNAAQDPVISEIDARIDSLKRNLDGLLQRFTEEHPDVVGTKRVIAQLEEQKRQEIAAREKNPALFKKSVASSSNPVYRELKVSLAKAEANVASLRVRVSELEGRYQQLKDSARMVPEVEAELAQLNRDYEINKKNYETLVARRESAEISGEMDSASGVAGFKILEPARVSNKPVAPNRILLLPVLLLGSLGAGIAASFAVSKMQPVFHDNVALREMSGLPVLGTISLKISEHGRRIARRHLFAFVSGVAALIVTYGAAMAVLLSSTARVA
jgi:protein tyrosine kinase modulator